jgi:hypothetical protein
MTDIGSLVIQIRECLNQVTLVELANSSELQEELTNLKTLIDDFFGLINNKKLALILKVNKK